MSLKSGLIMAGKNFEIGGDKNHYAHITTPKQRYSYACRMCRKFRYIVIIYEMSNGYLSVSIVKKALESYGEMYPPYTVFENTKAAFKWAYTIARCHNASKTLLIAAANGMITPQTARNAITSQIQSRWVDKYVCDIHGQLAYRQYPYRNSDIPF